MAGGTGAQLTDPGTGVGLPLRGRSRHTWAYGAALLYPRCPPLALLLGPAAPPPAAACTPVLPETAKRVRGPGCLGGACSSGLCRFRDRRKWASPLELKEVSSVRPRLGPSGHLRLLSCEHSPLESPPHPPPPPPRAQHHSISAVGGETAGGEGFGMSAERGRGGRLGLCTCREGATSL